jgi:hypothetical protein
MSRDKNDGNAMFLGDETILQVNTGQAWHLHISDESTMYRAASRT